MTQLERRSAFLFPYIAEEVNEEPWFFERYRLPRARGPPGKGIERMNDDYWCQATVTRILSVEGDDWRRRITDIVEDARRLFANFEISEDAYEAVEAAYSGRLERTATSKGRHEERETSLSGISKTIQSKVRLVPAIKAGVRGPSRYTPEERHERIRYLRRQADLAKLPADLSAEYTRAELSVISNVLFEIYKSAAGVCELALEALAAKARVSKRCVQDAIGIANRLGHLLVERRGPKPSRITVLMPRIQKWLNGPDATLLMDKIEELLEAIKSPSYVADICHSSSPDPSQDAQEAPESVEARVGAVSRPQPPAGLQSKPRAIPDHGRIPASKFEAWSAIIDAATRLRMTRDDPAPS